MTIVVLHRDPKEWKQKCQQSDTKCVCQICSCHKHHCPPKHVPFSADTTNHELYKPHNVTVERVPKMAYSLNKSHYDPNLLKSTYREAYKGQPSEPIQLKSRYAYHPNNSKFYDQTEYNKSYAPNKIEVERKTHCNAEYRPNSARFDGSTTYGTAFKAKKAQENHCKAHYAYQSNNLPFYGQTTYGESFQKYKVEHERSQTSVHGHYTGNPGKFEGKSSYNENYKGLQNPRRHPCFIEELPPRPRECSPGKEHLHFCANQYNWK